MAGKSWQPSHEPPCRRFKKREGWGRGNNLKAESRMLKESADNVKLLVPLMAQEHVAHAKI